MAWVRLGDTSAMHPMVLAPMEFPDKCDDRLVNELHGFITRCAAQSGAHKTDYVVSAATAIQVAGPTRFEALIWMALQIGEMSEVTLENGRVAYKIIDNDPDFLHLRLKSEIDFENQRRQDNSNPSLTIPVRLRDGDSCRWCGAVVSWGDRKSGRAGTYDHLIPGQQAEFDTYIVSCKACNSSRKNGEFPKGITGLLPVPTKPYFAHSTVKWLTDHPYVAQNGLAIPKPTANQVQPGHRVDGSQPPARATARVDDSQSPARTDTPTRSANLAPSESAVPGTGPITPSTDSDARSTTVHPSSHTQTEQAPIAASGSDEATGPQERHGQPPPDDLLDICRSQQIPVDREGTESVSTGRDGSGRDGTRLVGSRTPARGAVSPGTDPRVVVTRPARGGRRRRGRRSAGGRE